MGGKRGRKPKYEKLGYTKQEFKELLLRLYVDENFNKVSDRQVLEKLMLYGFVNENKYTKLKRPSSLGTLSSWKENLELKEYDVYDFHKENIKNDYETWSKRFNRGHSVDYFNEMSDDIIKVKMLEYFGFNKSRKSLKQVEEQIKGMYNSLGYDGEYAIQEFYDSLGVEA